jgi:hypothetical protein
MNVRENFVIQAHDEFHRPLRVLDTFESRHGLSARKSQTRDIHSDGITVTGQINQGSSNRLGE